MTRDLEVKVDELRMKVKELEAIVEALTLGKHRTILHMRKNIMEDKKRIRALEDLINSQFAPDTAGHPHDGGWVD